MSNEEIVKSPEQLYKKLLQDAYDQLVAIEGTLLVTNDPVNRRKYNLEISQTSEQIKRYKKELDDIVQQNAQQNEKQRFIEYIMFYSACLNRDAFHADFIYNSSRTKYSDFYEAIGDTLRAFNTGKLKTREGQIENPEKGITYITYRPWREKLDKITEIIEGIRKRLYEAGSLDENLMDKQLQVNPEFADVMDEERQKVIDLMNSIGKELDLPPLRGINRYK